MGYKVVMTDLDGTLLTKNHDISEENQRALIELTEKKIKIVFASGRMYKAIKRITTEYDGDAIVVSCNGGYIVDEANNHIISESHFDNDTSIAIIEILEKHNLSHHFYTGDTVYARHGSNSKMFQAMQGFLDELKINLIAHSPLGQFIREGARPYKFGVIIDKGTNSEGLKQDLAMIPEIDFFMSAETLLDIMPKGVNKGFALHQVAQYLGMSASEIVACGDHENDIEMIQAAGMGIAAPGYVPALGDVSDVLLDEKTLHVIAFINDTFF